MRDACLKRRTFLLAIFCLCLLVGGLVGFMSVKRPETADWVPFVLPWDDSSPTVIDASGLLDGPAGRHGFLQARDGHFYFEDGTRARFWGVSVTFGACFPTHGEAEAVAGRLAKFGFNLVRFHHMDGRRRPDGILDPDYADTQHLDPAQLERLDYFIYQLKGRGIYADLNLLVSRNFTEADNVTDARDLPRLCKFVTLFDDRLIELQKDYAGKLLTHYNNYTGARYVDEPAVALIETANENSLFRGWLNDNLNGKRGNIYDIPGHYSDILDERWNRWLRKRYGDRASLDSAWSASEGGGVDGLLPDEDPALNSVRRILHSEAEGFTGARVRDLLRFYYDLEVDYFQGMKSYLREALGVRVPVTGTNNYFSLASIASQATIDFVDAHAYWQHPQFPRVLWSPTDWYIGNTPMVGDGAGGTIARLSLSPVAGRPFTVTEYNHPFPNRYQAEAPLMVSAYACLQDWDAVLLFSYHNSRLDWERGYVARWFDVGGNPVLMGLMPAASRLFLRRDVRAAERFVGIVHTEEETLDSVRRHGRTTTFSVEGVPVQLPLVHGVRRETFSGNRSRAAAEYGLENITAPYVSDTGELRWDPSRGLFTVDTPRSQGAVGLLSTGRVDLSNLSLACSTGFAAVVLTALDGGAIGSPGSMLLTAVARAENTGMVWNRAKNSVSDRWGREPVLVEPVEADVTLRLPLGDGSRSLRAFALDARGSRGAALSVSEERTGGVGSFTFTVGREHGTVWYEVECT